MYPRMSLFRLGYVLLVLCSGVRLACAQFVVPGPEFRLNGPVTAVETDAAGNVYLGGSFDDFNGDRTKGLGLVRLTNTGARHPLWDIGAIQEVSDLLVHGKFLYVSGSFGNVRTLSAGTFSRAFLLRIHLTGINEGKVDTTWIPTPNAAVTAMATDGTHLFIAGNFNSVNGTNRSRLAKLLISSADPDEVDANWNPAPNNRVAALEYAAPSLYVCGEFSIIGGVVNNYLARLSTSGSGAADAGWKPNLNRPVIALESGGGHIYISGDFTFAEGVMRRYLARYSTAAGAAVIDSVWKPVMDAEVRCMLHTGASVYLAGPFTSVSSAPRRFLAKVSTSGVGATDGNFFPDPNGEIRDLKLHGADLLVGGGFHTSTGVPSSGYALMDGTTGASLGSMAGIASSAGKIRAMEPVIGGMMIGGRFDWAGGVPRTNLARLHSDGTLDESYAPSVVGFNRTVNDLKVDGAMLYLCGDFLSVQGAPTRNLARVNAMTGVIDSGWFCKPLAPLLCLETDDDFVYFGASGMRFVEKAPNTLVEVHNLARVSKEAPATLDESWNPFVVDQNNNPSNASVQDMRLHGSNLIIGGHFAFIVNPTNIFEAYQRICLACLPTTGWGQPNTGWGTTFLDRNSEIGSVNNVLLYDDSLYVSGNFVSVNGNPWYYVAKLDPDTGVWDSGFDASAIDFSDPLGSEKISALFAADGQLYLVGGFQAVFTGSQGDGFDSSPYIARVNPLTGMLDPSWYPYPNAPLSRLACSGPNLWVSGQCTEMGDAVTGGPVILSPYSAPYLSWLNAHFTPAEMNDPDLSAPFWDHDGDGESNLMEATFNTDPFDPRKTYHMPDIGTSGLPLLRSEKIGEEVFLTIEFTRWKTTAHACITASPQFGDDLSHWTRSGVVISTTSLDSFRERVKIRDSIPNLPKSFGRVRLTTHPP